MAKTSPTQRSLELMRDEGYTAAVVERWNPYARVRQDLFGCIDLVAVRKGGPGVTAIQCTTGSNLAARVEKAMAMPIMPIWMAAGNRFEFHGWRKLLKNSKRPRAVWAARIKQVVLIGNTLEVV